MQISGSGQLSKRSMKALDAWFEDMRPAAEAAYEQARQEAERHFGGPVRLVGDTFGDLSKAPGYIFEPAD